MYRYGTLAITETSFITESLSITERNKNGKNENFKFG